MLNAFSLLLPNMLIYLKQDRLSDLLTFTIQKNSSELDSNLCIRRKVSSSSCNILLSFFFLCISWMGKLSISFGTSKLVLVCDLYFMREDIFNSSGLISQFLLIDFNSQFIFNYFLKLPFYKFHMTILAFAIGP